MSHGQSLRHRVFSVILTGLTNAFMRWETKEELDSTLEIPHILCVTNLEEGYFYGLFWLHCEHVKRVTLKYIDLSFD